MLRTHRTRDRIEDRLVGAAHGVIVREIELDAAHIGLVGYGFGMEFEDHRVSDSSGCLYGLVRTAGDHGLNGRNAVGLQKVLGFGFGQQRAAVSARLRDGLRRPRTSLGMEHGLGNLGFKSLGCLVQSL